jgi:hypothetical protein
MALQRGGIIYVFWYQFGYAISIEETIDDEKAGYHETFK